MLDRNRIVSQLNTMRYERGLILGDYTASTNSKVRDMAEHGAAEGCTLIVDRQTAGRGRHGRTFHSPEGGLYLSTLLRPEPDTDPGQITCCAAVAAARAIESLCDLKVDIKWVNDLYISGRKVAGILAEGVLAPDGTLAAVVLGIGINVGVTVFPPELADIATSLGNEGAALTREDVAAAFLNGLEQALHGDVEETMAEYRRRNMAVGRQVTVVQGNHTYTATAEQITDRGHLLVRTPDGETHELNSGEISIRL